MIASFCILCLSFFSSLIALEKNEVFQPWLILYSDKAEFSELKKYNPIIFDSRSYPSLPFLLNENIRIYGRVDLSQGIQKTSRTCQAGSSNDERRKWISLIIEKQIPEMLNSGFNGIFLDISDHFRLGSLAQIHPAKETFIQLILLMKAHFPNTPILLHGGFSLLNDVGFSIQGIVESGVTTTFDQDTGQYKFIDSNVRDKRISMLKQLHHIYPDLQIFTLDYWDPKDTRTIEKIYEIERKNGFIPYVATEKLNKIVKVS